MLRHVKIKDTKEVTMDRRKFSIDQIIRILAEAELPGITAASVARKYGISEQTISR